MNTRHIAFTAASMLLVLSYGWSTSAPAAFKCWTNKDGVKECGNAVPPEYSQQEISTVNKAGIITDTSKPAKSAAEIEAEKRAAAEKANQERLAKEQAEKDRMLLDTYSSEDDITMTRDGKISNLDNQIRLTNSHIDKLKQNLDDIIKQAAATEKRGETPDASVAASIKNVKKQIKENEDFNVKQRAEQEAIRQKFDADLAHYREVKARAKAQPDAKAGQ